MDQNKFEKNSKITISIITTVSILILIFIAETILSYIDEETINENKIRYIRLREHPPSSIRFFYPYQASFNNTDSALSKKVRLKIDDDGFIYPSKIYENPDKTFLFLGGSTTECLYVNEKNRFPYLVGRYLEKDGKKVNSFNSGVCGSNSAHSIDILLNKGLQLKPNVVIMMHNVNDLNILLYEEVYWNKNPYRSLLIESNTSYYKNFFFHVKGIVNAVVPRIYKRLIILKKNIFSKDRNVMDEFKHMRGKKIIINKQMILNKFEENILTFIDVCKCHKTIPILMTQANRIKEHPDSTIISNWTTTKDFGITYEDYKDIYDDMNDLIRSIGKYRSVLVIDLAYKVPQSDNYMYDAIHLNDFGSKFVAKIIAEQLINI